MVSRVEKIVFIIRDSFFELYGEKRKVWNRKRKRISWSRLLYEIRFFFKLFQILVQLSCIVYSFQTFLSMYIRSFHEFIQSLSKKNRKTDTFVILIIFFEWIFIYSPSNLWSIDSQFTSYQIRKSKIFILNYLSCFVLLQSHVFKN